MGMTNEKKKRETRWMSKQPLTGELRKPKECYRGPRYIRYGYLEGNYKQEGKMKDTHFSVLPGAVQH